MQCCSDDAALVMSTQQQSRQLRKKKFVPQLQTNLIGLGFFCSLTVKCTNITTAANFTIS